MRTPNKTTDNLARKEYSFVDVATCNMCGSPAANCKVLGKRLDRRQGLWPKKEVGISTTVVKCRQCGLIFTNPMPVPGCLGQHYGVPPEEYWKEEYFVVSPDYLREQIERFETLTGRRAAEGHMAALDVGAGIGKGMIALAKAGFNAYGVEPSEPFYERAVTAMGISRNRIQLSTVEEAAFDVSSFDFINMGAVLEHLYDPAAALRKIIPWLKPGGLVHVEVPSADWLMSRIARQFYRLLGSDYVINLSPMHTPYHLYEFKPKSFQFNGRLNGYAVADYHYWVCESYMPRLLKPLVESVMAISRTGMQLAVWLRKAPVNV